MAQSSQDRSQVRRIVTNVAIVVVMLVVLAAVLWNTAYGSLVSNQRSNSTKKLATAEAQLASAQESGESVWDQFDADSQATLDTLAYFYLLNDPVEGRLAAIADAWSLTGLMLVDEDGSTVMASEGMAPDTSSEAWAALLSDGTPYTDGSTRYYASAVDGSTTLVGAADTAAALAKEAEASDVAAALDGISVGEGGYVGAIDGEGVIAYDADESLVGRAAADVFSEVPADGFDGFTQLDGTRYYVVAAEADGYTLCAMVPASEFSNNAMDKVATVVVAFAVIATLIVCYCQFLYADGRRRLEQGKAPEGSFVRLGANYVLDRAFVKKAVPILVVGTLAVFAVSWYAQSLASITVQITHNDHKVAAIDEALDGVEAKADAIREEYTSEYVAKAEAVAQLIAADTRLVDHDYLEKIAELDGLESIFVFDETGTTEATSTRNKDFALPEDETDQSYAFWDVVKGVETSHVQSVVWDGGAGVTFYVGVNRVDAEGMVEIGVSSTTLAERISSATMTGTLADIPVGNGGYLMAVSAEDATVSFMADDKYEGMAAADLGVTEAALADEYLGYQTINGVRCLVSTTLSHDLYVLVCVPTSGIGEGDLPSAVLTAILAFVLLLPQVLQLVIQRRPQGAPVAEEEGDGQLKAQPVGTFELKTASGGIKRVQSISGRWSGLGTPWAEKTPEGKLGSLMKGLLLVVTVALLVFVYALNPNDSSALAFIASGRWEHVPNIFSWSYVGTLVLMAAVVVWAVRLVFGVVFNSVSNTRVETIGRLACSFIKYAVWIAVLFYSLSLVGVDAATLWASAGIVTLIIGLGAQKLIGDVIAGIFLVFEGEFRVGDIVTVGGWTGTVLEIGIRTTKIEDGSQNIKIINNSAIADVVNMTKKYSYATVDLTVSYETPLEKLEALLKGELPTIAEKLPQIVAGPFYKGVVSLGGDSLVIRVIAQCEEGSRGQLTRDLTRQLLLVCDHNDVAPYKGAGEYFWEEVVATEEERQAADEFVKEQAQISGDVHVGEVAK